MFAGGIHMKRNRRTSNAAAEKLLVVKPFVGQELKQAHVTAVSHAPRGR